MYTGSITLFQRLFVALTGEQSDLAIAFSTVILAAGFTPVKNALQSFVDKRFKQPPDPDEELKALGKALDERIYAVDVRQVTRLLLDDSVAAFDALSGALSLKVRGERRLVHTHGDWTGDARLSMPLV